jgi:serine/threonine protein kinase
MPKTYALKCLSKKHIVDEKMEDHVENEITIMSEIDHPFVLDYYGAMQDSKQIYFVLEVLLGGELFQILRTHERFPETTCRFYAASVLSAFSKMHAKKIAYRDLKPENLVLDSNGYLRIVDFGLARKIKNGKTWTLCGTPDYLAPEVILSEGHDWAVDYWALGILLYEMCAGVPPFAADDPMQVYENIVEGNLHIPRDFSRNMGDIIRKLLKSYPSKRLGRTRGGSKEVMKHKFFSGFDWHALLDQKMDVPLKPKIKSDTDASNFDMYEELDESTIPACPQWTPIL